MLYVLTVNQGIFRSEQSFHACIYTRKNLAYHQYGDCFENFNPYQREKV
nr:MAG TPA: hypothetical protein [Caudoviricetes sp.]